MIKLLTIIGARPQIIKAAALSRAIANGFADKIQEKILHTGQHYDDNMSEVFFCELGVPKPDYNLQVGSGSHGLQTAKMIEGIEQVLLAGDFDALVVYGDTNSTLAGALAASKLNIPIIHIEAGLRSFNMAMPEEQNRVLCDQLSSFLFVPTQTAFNNLMQEGFANTNLRFANGKTRKLINSGDIMYDNSIYFSELAEQRSSILQQYNLSTNAYVLATIHRNNNTDSSDRLSAIVEALIEIANSREQTIVLPLHPRTAKLLPLKLNKELYDQFQNTPNIKHIPPASFLEMIVLEKNASLIMTDSGGVQKEAYFFNKACVLFRAETEWVELVDNGTALLADANKNEIIKAYDSLLAKKMDFPAVFGDAHAAEKILEVIVEAFG